MINNFATGVYNTPFPLRVLLNINTNIQLNITMAKSANSTNHLGAGVAAIILTNDNLDNFNNNFRNIKSQKFNYCIKIGLFPTKISYNFKYANLFSN